VKQVWAFLAGVSTGAVGGPCAPLGAWRGTYNCGPILRLTNHNFHPLLLKMSGDLTPPLLKI